MTSSTPAQASPASEYKPRYIDIGINLADRIYQRDLPGVISRAQEIGCHKLLVTGSDLTSSQEALTIAEQHPGIVYTTAGVHPCASAIFSSAPPTANNPAGQSVPCPPPEVGATSSPSSPQAVTEKKPDPAKTESVISALHDLVETSLASPTASPLVAFGEIGLDYDRLHYSDRATQLHAFAAQLDLVLSLSRPLPLFLHSRAAHADFVSLLREKFGTGMEKLGRGAVVHSFTGSVEELRELVELRDVYVGVNGCSFKTEANCEAVKEIPLDRIMMETDGPWCEVRASHWGWRYLVEASLREKEREKEREREALSAGASDAVNGVGTATEQESQVQQHDPRGRGKKKPPKQQQPQKQKNQKQEPEVPLRWPAVKKEKWVEGAMIKGRNEPCMIERVATIVAGIKGVSVEEVCEAAWKNTVRVFGLGVEAEV